MNKKTTKVEKEYPQIRFLVDSYYSTQKMRMIADSRLLNLQKNWGISKKNFENYKQNIGGEMKDIELWLKSEIKEELKNYSIWNDWLKNIKGIDTCLAGGLIAWAYGPVKGTYKMNKEKKLIPIKRGQKIEYSAIGRFPTISAFYSYCGFGVDEDGKAVRRQKGKLSNWHPKLKSHCWKIGKSFVRVGKGGGYRKQYDTKKLYYKKKFPKESKLHIDNMAVRKTIKLFLSHFFVRWNELEGREYRSPYAVEKLGHKYLPPFEK